MDSTRTRGPDHEAVPAATLGSLIHVDGAGATASEREWVDLVHAIAARDQRALYALYDRAHRIVFTLIMRITHNRETAEEVTLDVFHDVWRRAASYDPAGGTVVGWIMNQARSRAIDRLRFDQRKKRVGPQGRAESLVAAADGGPADRLELHEEGRRLRSALVALMPHERQVIEAAFFSELTYSEVATRLNQPLGTVKTRMRSGLTKLRKALAEAEGGR